METQQVTKQKVIAELTRSPHGDLQQYLPTTVQAAQHDPEFLAHLIAWNEKNGAIRDSKVALPVMSMIPGFEFNENSLAHLAKLDPRNLVRAVTLTRNMNHVPTDHPGRSEFDGVSLKLYSRPFKRVIWTVEAYLRAREADIGWFDRTALQHRNALKSLYSSLHIKPSKHADNILFKRQYARGSVFEAVKNLKSMNPTDAAATILQKRIPFLIASHAIDKPTPDLMLALINSMSPSELINHTKELERWGMNEVSAVRGAYDIALSKAAQSTKSTLRTTEAAKAVTSDRTKAKLQATQEKQLDKLGGIDGDWLVLGDKSSSMVESIETAKIVAGTLARLVKGRVHLVFFDTTPRAFDVSGKTYEQILAETKYVKEGGATSIGVGLQWAIDNDFEPGGIAIISDGAENSYPMFTPLYGQLCKKLDRNIPVYLYWTKCHMPNPMNNDPERLARNMHNAEHDLQVLDLRGGVDYHSLPNVIQTMRVNRYSLIQEIMETPLLTFADVFGNAKAATV